MAIATQQLTTGNLSFSSPLLSDNKIPSEMKVTLLRKGSCQKKKTVFFWEISPKSVYPPPHPPANEGPARFSRNWFLDKN